MIESKSQYYIRSLLKLEISKPVCELGGTAYENTTWRLPDGNIHRDFGPAVEWEDGNKEWWIGGDRHREDGPAVESADGTREWFLNGVKHREHGPAVEHADGAKEWWIHGKEHREDGPAVELKSGDVEYYLYGIKVSQKEFEFWKQDNKKE